MGGPSPRRRPSVDADRSRPGRSVPRRRDLRGRPGSTPRPLRHAAARSHEGRTGRADELALRGRLDQLHEPPSGDREWHAIVAELRRRTDVFDDWGMFAYTNTSTRVDDLTEIDVGIWEQQLGDEAWSLFAQAKRDIAAVARRNGSISAAMARAGRARSTPFPRSSAGATT